MLMMHINEINNKLDKILKILKKLDFENMTVFFKESTCDHVKEFYHDEMYICPDCGKMRRKGESYE